MVLGSWVRWQHPAQPHQAHRTDTRFNGRILQGHEEHLQQLGSQGRLGHRHAVQQGSGCSKQRDARSGAASQHRKQAGCVVQVVLTWLWMTCLALQASGTFCKFLDTHELCLSYRRRWFPVLNKKDVKPTEFDELPGIRLGCKDFDTLQKLRIKISSCCCQVCITAFMKNKNLSRTNKTKQRHLILLHFCSEVRSDGVVHCLPICHMLSRLFTPAF